METAKEALTQLPNDLMMYPDHSIDQTYASQVIKKFKKLLSLRDKKGSRRLEENEGTKIDIVAHISVDSQQSLVTMSEAFTLPQTTLY